MEFKVSLNPGLSSEPVPNAVRVNYQFREASREPEWTDDNANKMDDNAEQNRKELK